MSTLMYTTNAPTHIHSYTYRHYTQIHTYTHLPTTYIHINSHKHIHSYIYAHMCTLTHTHIYMCRLKTHDYTYIYMYTHGSSPCQSVLGCCFTECFLTSVPMIPQNCHIPGREAISLSVLFLFWYIYYIKMEQIKRSWTDNKSAFLKMLTSSGRYFQRWMPLGCSQSFGAICWIEAVWANQSWSAQSLSWVSGTNGSKLVSCWNKIGCGGMANLQFPVHILKLPLPISSEFHKTPSLDSLSQVSSQCRPSLPSLLPQHPAVSGTQ